MKVWCWQQLYESSSTVCPCSKHVRVPKNMQGEDAAALMVAVASKHLAWGWDKFPGDACAPLVTVDCILSAVGSPDGVAVVR